MLGEASYFKEQILPDLGIWKFNPETLENSRYNCEENLNTVHGPKKMQPSLGSDSFQEKDRWSDTWKRIPGD